MSIFKTELPPIGKLACWIVGATVPMIIIGAPLPNTILCVVAVVLFCILTTDTKSVSTKAEPEEDLKEIARQFRNRPPRFDSFHTGKRVKGNRDNIKFNSGKRDK